MGKVVNEAAVENMKMFTDFYAQSFEQVSSFYTHSFDQLVMYVAWGGAIAIAVIPFLLTLYQSKIFKIESREIKESISSELNKEISRKIDSEVKKLRNLFEEESSKLRQDLLSNELIFRNEVCNLRADNFVFKAETVMDDQESMNYYALAAIMYLSSGNNSGVNVQLYYLKEKLKNITITNKETLKQIKNLVDALEQEKKRSGLYFTEILEIKEKIVEADHLKSFTN